MSGALNRLHHPHGSNWVQLVQLATHASLPRNSLLQQCQQEILCQLGWHASNFEREDRFKNSKTYLSSFFTLVYLNTGDPSIASMSIILAHVHIPLQHPLDPMCFVPMNLECSYERLSLSRPHKLCRMSRRRSNLLVTGLGWSPSSDKPTGGISAVSECLADRAYLLTSWI
jgi:hypothetical protein